jgi:sedoheptulokinase
MWRKIQSISLAHIVLALLIYVLFILTAKIWDRVMSLGAQDCAASSLRVVPTLLGERHVPEQNASILNVDPGTLGLGQVFRAVCSGLIENLHR